MRPLCRGFASALSPIAAFSDKKVDNGHVGDAHAPVDKSVSCRSQLSSMPDGGAALSVMAVVERRDSSCKKGGMLLSVEQKCSRPCSEARKLWKRAARNSGLHSFRTHGSQRAGCRKVHAYMTLITEMPV